MGRKAIYYQQHPLQTEIIFMTLFLTICISEHSTCSVFFSPRWPSEARPKLTSFQLTVNPTLNQTYPWALRVVCLEDLGTKTISLEDFGTKTIRSENHHHSFQKPLSWVFKASRNWSDCFREAEGYWVSKLGVILTSKDFSYQPHDQGNRSKQKSTRFWKDDWGFQWTGIELHCGALASWLEFSEHRMHQDSMSQPPLQLGETVWLISGR